MIALWVCIFGQSFCSLYLQTNKTATIIRLVNFESTWILEAYGHVICKKGRNNCFYCSFLQPIRIRECIFSVIFCPSKINFYQIIWNKINTENGIHVWNNILYFLCSPRAWNSNVHWLIPSLSFYWLCFDDVKQKSSHIIPNGYK